MSKTMNKFSPEVRARAVRMVPDHKGQHGSRWSAIVSILSKIGCAAQTLNEWVKKAEVESGRRIGIPTEMAVRLKALERSFGKAARQDSALRSDPGACGAPAFLGP